MKKKRLFELAAVCKGFAIFTNIAVRFWICPPRWKTDPLLTLIEAIVFAILALLPNKWLVTNQIVFSLALVLLVSPVTRLIGAMLPPFFWLMWGVSMFVVIYGFLPAALIFSRMRLKRGEQISYV